MRVKNIFIYVACIGAALAAGAIGALATTSNISTWYVFLQKPSLIPPNWVFAPVWTTLYVLMGTALYLLVKSKASNKLRAYWLFSVQLVLNALWSLLFFGRHLLWGGVVVILLLLGVIIATQRTFAAHNKIASYLLIPYIAWVGFATYLNLGVAFLN